MLLTNERFAAREGDAVSLKMQPCYIAWVELMRDGLRSGVDELEAKTVL